MVGGVASEEEEWLAASFIVVASLPPKTMKHQNVISTHQLNNGKSITTTETTDLLPKNMYLFQTRPSWPFCVLALPDYFLLNIKMGGGGGVELRGQESGWIDAY